MRLFVEVYRYHRPRWRRARAGACVERFDHQASVAQVAVAWLLAKNAVTSVLIGASKLHQLDDNLASVDVKLSEAEIAELDAATTPPAVYPNWFIDRLRDQVTAQALGRVQ